MAPRIEPDPGAVLDTILSPEWMIRRKDSVAFGTESLLRRTHSFDFEVPRKLVLHPGPPSKAVAIVPLGFWWKAPGKYTNIDFIDEAGVSRPLSTSASDEEITLAVMLEFSSRVLCKPLAAINIETLQDIANVVLGDPIDARNELKNTWLVNRSGGLSCLIADRQRLEIHPADPSRAEVAVLAQDDGFAALLEVAAMASIFTVELRERLDERRIIKLRYEETCTGRRGTDTYQKPGSLLARAYDRLRSIALLLGLAAYDVDIGNAFVRARRYHFEEDAPAGLRFTDVSSKRAADAKPQKARHSDPRVHLHEKDLDADTYLTVRGKLVVTDEWLNLAIVCTAVAIAVLIGIEANIGSLDPQSSQSVIAIAVLVPSIAMSIVWRRVHWLVVRLQRWLRLAFGSLGVLLFYVALRIAESPTQIERDPSAMPPAVSRIADSGEIEEIACIGIYWGAVVVALLLFARIKSEMATRRLLQS